MALRERMRAVIYCQGTGFTKVLDRWESLPQVGQDFCIELYPGQGWTVRTTNQIAAQSPDGVRTFFFESDDLALFSCLCGCLDEKGWIEIERVERPGIAQKHAPTVGP